MWSGAGCAALLRLYVQKYVMKRRKMPSKQLRMIAGAEKGKESIETSGGEITKLGFYDAM